MGGACFNADLAYPRDQAPLDARTDILRFEGPVLADDLRVAGDVVATLCVSTDVEDTAFTARLVDVDPDGRALGMVDGIRHLSRRDPDGAPRPAVPGEVYPLAVELGPVAWRVPAGHHLRLDVSSSNFPRFARHANVFGPWGIQDRIRVARQTLHTGGTCASSIEISVLPGS